MQRTSVNKEYAKGEKAEIYSAICGDHSAEPNFHKNLELLYNVSGTKNVTVGSVKYVLQPDNVMIVDSYQLHHYGPSGGEQMLLILPPSYCENFFTYRKNKTLTTNAVTDSEYCREKIKPYFVNTVNNKGLDLFTVKANADMMLSAICAKAGLTDAPYYTLDGVDEILSYIEQNYDKDLTLTDLAEHFGYSKYYFSRMFNETFHTSLNDYISVTRLQRTFKYYDEHDCSITTAALNGGFKSMPTFYRALKKNHVELRLRNSKK